MTKKHEQTKRIKKAAAKARAKSITYLPLYRSDKTLDQVQRAKETMPPFLAELADLVLGGAASVFDFEGEIVLNDETVHVTKLDGDRLLSRWFGEQVQKEIAERRKPKLSLVTETDETLTDEAPTDGGAGSVEP